ncbi:M48 family metallopeptidase [Thioalkalivibrio sulfidiphilus]|uniref:M48 family metallopeptidase n=1 Tax=Thioalkalivibrio sulfidiphilus TaxID=1033854 RepID=UPI003B2D372A
MSTIQGYYYDGRTARRHEASLEMAGGRVRVSVGGEIVRDSVSLNDIQISSRLGNTPRSLRFADGALFETLDHLAVDRLLKGSDRAASGLLHRLESSLKYVALALVVTVIAVWAGVRYGVPALAQMAAYAMPVEVSRSLDRGTLELLDARLLRPSTLSESEQARLQQVFAPLVDEVPGEFAVRVLFRDAGHSIGPNALALPSGTVVFTDQLVQLAEEDAELLAVFAHELGHVVHRHGLRQTLQGSMLTLAAVVVLGDVSSLSSVMVGLPVLLTELGYSRAFEREADDYALRVMARHGIDSRHFAAILSRMEQGPDCEEIPGGCEPAAEGRWDGYLSTHPPTQERVRRIETMSSQH